MFLLLLFLFQAFLKEPRVAHIKPTKLKINLFQLIMTWFVTDRLKCASPWKAHILKFKPIFRSVYSSLSSPILADLPFCIITTSLIFFSTLTKLQI